MEDPTPPNDDGDSGSAFDPDEVAEDEADVPMEADESASEAGGAPDVNEDDLSDIVGSDDATDDGSPRPGRTGSRQQPRPPGGGYQRRPSTIRIAEPTVTTTTSLPTLPIPRFISRKVTNLTPLYKSNQILALNSEALPPLVPHFTSCLMEKPAFGKRSVVREMEVLGGDRMDGGTEMSEGGLAERVRVVHEEAPGMVGWEAWAGGLGEFGEGWRPSDKLSKDGGVEQRKRLWEGVGNWDELAILSEE